MLFKVLVVILLVVIFSSLGKGLYHLVRNETQSTKVVKSLTWRIALSVLLFALLMLAYTLGWITPNPGPV